MLANAGIAVAKFIGYGITGSSSMLAEAVHSVADTSNQGLLLLGQKRARVLDLTSWTASIPQWWAAESIG